MKTVDEWKKALASDRTWSQAYAWIAEEVRAFFAAQTSTGDCSTAEMAALIAPVDALSKTETRRLFSGLAALADHELREFAHREAPRKSYYGGRCKIVAHMRWSKSGASPAIPVAPEKSALVQQAAPDQAKPASLQKLAWVLTFGLPKMVAIFPDEGAARGIQARLFGSVLSRVSADEAKKLLD